MLAYDIIKRKRDGGELSREEIGFLISGYTSGAIPDYQMAAFAMAVCWRGMSERETAMLTDAMALSGDSLDLSRFGALTADKHSTGGVGDKTTLVVVPLAAALGVKVAKMTGRALGHTGGTADKLESIPGYCLNLSHERFLAQVDEVGAAVVSQSGQLAPADKKLYALRDVTATVDCIPLIASSIMSKKLAAGARAIVLDVKVGSGAFMKSEAEARELARLMTAIGAHCGRRVSALLTDMDAPLGSAVGNRLEVAEAARILRGERGGHLEELREVCLALAAEMAALALGMSRAEADKKAEAALAGGQALSVFRRWIEAQGGDADAALSPAFAGKAAVQAAVKAPRDGWMTRMDSEAIGMASLLLGAGRTTKDEAIDPDAGIVLLKKTGEQVRAGEAIAILHTSGAERFAAGAEKLLSAVDIGSEMPERRPVILGAVRREE